jgi:hypothetical protein
MLCVTTWERDNDEFNTRLNDRLNSMHSAISAMLGLSERQLHNGVQSVITDTNLKNVEWGRTLLSAIKEHQANQKKANKKGVT